MESTGHYPIERRQGEIERLHIQAEALRFDTGIMLDRIGVANGWRCLDLGCGPGGIIELLSKRAGATGQVVGLDADPVFLDHARALVRDRGLGNVELIQGDAYRTGLACGSFDLVHVRFVGSTVGRPEDLIAEAIALACSGGSVAFQEADISTLKCYPPHPAWDRLTQLLDQVFACVGSDIRLAQRLYQLARHAGLEDVQYRPFLVGVRSGDPMVDFVPATVESVRSTIARHALIEEEDLSRALRACRSHLADPNTVFTYVTVAQVWGRRLGTLER